MPVVHRRPQVDADLVDKVVDESHGCHSRLTPPTAADK